MFKGDLIPFVLSLAGVSADYLTTGIGLSLGFVEKNPNYNPLTALIFLWSSISCISLLLKDKPIRKFLVTFLTLTSFLGMVNNIGVLFGVL